MENPDSNTLKRIVPDWAEAMNCAVTVCNRDCRIIYMNRRSRDTFGADKLGQSLIPCHSERSREIIARMLADGESNCYTIEKHGLRKMIYQTPWRDEQGAIAGLVEISMVIPPDMPHYIRQ